MPYRRIEREDGSSYTAWEADATPHTQTPPPSTTPNVASGARLTYNDEGELVVTPPETPILPEPESVINERMRVQSGGANGCMTFGCLFTLMLIAIFVCGAIYFLPIIS